MAMCVLPADALPVAVGRIAFGTNHACSITTNGGVQCWGLNINGQLGDGSTTQRNTPVAISGLTDIVALAASGGHTCALSSAGGVKCWGLNDQGQLGDGSNTTRLAPVPVTGLSSGVKAIAAAGSHTCAFTNAGAALCWGANNYGGVGDGTATDRNVPTPVVSLGAGVSAIALGTFHSCAIGTGGAIWCWGGNGSGQLGDGSTISRAVPVAVTGFAGTAVSLAAGDGHTCAVDANGGVQCWGWNSSGQLGDNTVTQRLTPVGVSGFASGAVAVTAANYHTCAVSIAGAVSCWGWNGNGQLGDGTTTQRNAPVPASGLGSSVLAVAAGGSSSCALRGDGSVLCWGLNDTGQLGIGNTTARSTPAFVNGAVSLVAGSQHTCALSAGGGVTCWGQNYHGELGDGNVYTNSDTPVRVSGLGSGVTAIAAGGYHTCAVVGGGVQCWGYNGSGQLGDGTVTSRATPGPVSGLGSGVTAIAAGSAHTCALLNTGAVKCWGYNADGQLGDQSTVQRNVPVAVFGLASGIASIAAGNYHSCAVSLGGALSCWGANYYGELGDGTSTNRLQPVTVSGLSSGVASVAAGVFHTCARTTAGAVKCWGENRRGQLGRGTADFFVNWTPAAVSGLASGVAALAAGGAQTCAVTTGGAASCWGEGDYGELGDGTMADRTVPTAVSGLSSGVAGIVTGSMRSCARTTAGGVMCWGDNSQGQLGTGNWIASATPAMTLNVIESPYQIVRFDLSRDGLVGDSIGLNATASSGLAPAYASLTPAVCNLGVSWVDLYAEGLCVITASQPGNGNYFPAATVTRSLLVHAPLPHLSAGLEHNLVIDNYWGDVYAWGGNTGAKLGNNSTANSSVPVQIYPPQSPMTVAAGMAHSLAVDYRGNVYSWGVNNHDQLGIRLQVPASCDVPGDTTYTCSKVPLQVPGLSDVIAVGAGWGVSVALRRDGSVWTWGATGSPWKELGRATTTVPANTPGKVDLSALTSLPIVEIAVGYFHVVARKSDGTLIAWGRGEFGELGNGTASTGYASAPVNVTGLTNVVAISARGSHTLAKKADGTLWAWGWNRYGQIGNNSTTDQLVPVQVATNVVDFSAGYGFSLALRSDGTVLAWGLNKSGQLGITSTSTCGVSSSSGCVKSPTQLPAQPVSVVGVAAGGAHSILIRGDDSMVLFGDNASGQLGDKSKNFGAKFTQGIYDPDFALTPQGTYGSGMSVGAPSTSGGLNLQGLGNGFTFPLQAVNVPSPEIQVTLANLLQAQNIGLTGISANGDFAVKPPVTGDCDTIVFSSSTCFIRVVFTPTASGERNGTLTISSDLTDNPSLSFNLTGFGAVAPGAPTIDTVVVGNGQVTVNFNPSPYDGGAAITQYVASCGAFNSPPGGAYTYTLVVTGLTNGTTYACKVTATNAVGLSTSSATVNATPVPSYTVTPSAGANGSISPNTAQVVNAGTIVVFTVTPATGYHASVTGCGGSLVGNTYTTSAIAGNCSVAATFVINTYTVTPGAGPNGSIIPNVPQVVNHGANTTFTVMPNSGYNASVTGCGGSLAGNTYTTGPITANCTVNATFSNLTLVAVQSRKSHAGVDRDLPVTGALMVEPRSVGAGHRIVFQFSQTITQVASVVATDNNSQSFGNVFATFSGTEVTVHLVGAPDNRRVTISIAGVNGTGAAAVSMGFLMGDVNNSGSVNASDIAAIKARVGTMIVDGTNFQYDLNGSGQITPADLTAVRARAGMMLP